MPVAGFYFVYGDDTDLVAKKWLPDLASKYPTQTWLRLDATIDEIDVGKLTTEYYANDLFSEGKVLLIRNADKKHAQVAELIEELAQKPVSGNALVLISNSWNKTTRFGKLAKKYFIVREFQRPEIKPFDLLDSLTTKDATKALLYSNRLFEADYNPLAIFSLMFGHFMLLRQIKEKEGSTAEIVARELKQHQYRVKKAMVANRHWSKEGLAYALMQLDRLDSLLRTWQYDEKMLIQMTLIKLCL